MIETTIDFYSEMLKRKEKLLDDLIELLKFESVKDLDSATEAAPMGKTIDETLQYMLHRAEREGFQTEDIDGYIGYADFGESDDYIAVLGHLDVVPAPGQWTTPPFEPAIRDGKLYARGAIDDKGPTMAAFYAIKLLKELKLPLNRKIRLILGTDEESGMRCMKKYVEVLGAPKVGFSPDAYFPLIHAEKGQINAKLLMKVSKKQDSGPHQLLAFSSGERGNMVPDLADAEVATSEREAFEKAFAAYRQRRGLNGELTKNKSGVHIKLHGKTVHGMEPQNGINAAIELAHFLVDFDFSGQDHQFLSFINDTLFEDDYGDRLGLSVEHEEMGRLTVNAGIFHFQTDEQAVIQLNIRCPINTNYLRSIEILTEKCGEYGIEVNEIRKKDPHYVEKHHPVLKVLQSAYQKETSDEPTLLTSGGATYARFIKSGIAFGAVFPGKEMSAHQIDESIEVDDLLKAAAIYARALYTLSNLS